MYLQVLNDGFVVLEPAQNIPLIDWSKTTFNNVLLQGDKMNLPALNDSLIICCLSTWCRILICRYLSLPKVVSVSSCTNRFS